MYTYHSHHQLQQAQSWRCLQLHVRMRLTCRTQFLSLTYSHTHIQATKCELMYLLTHSHSQSIIWQTWKVIIPVAVSQSNNLEGWWKLRETDLTTYKTVKRTNQQPVQVFKNMLRIKLNLFGFEYRHNFWGWWAEKFDSCKSPAFWRKLWKAVKSSKNCSEYF